MTLCVDLTWDAINGSCWMKMPGMDRWPAFVKQNKEDQRFGILLRDVATIIKQFGSILPTPTTWSYLEISYTRLSEKDKKLPSQDDLAELTRFLRCWKSVSIKSEYILPPWFTTRLVKTMEMISTNAPLPFLRNHKKKPKKLRCINIIDDDDGGVDLFWREQPYTSTNILTGITHLFLNASELDMFETFQVDLLVEWLKSDDSKMLESLEVTEGGVSNEVWDILSSVSHSQLRHVTLYDNEDDTQKGWEEWNRFFQCNPTLTSLELYGYNNTNYFRTTRHILSLRLENFHYLTFSSLGDRETIAYTVNDVLMVFNSHLWSWTCNGPQVTLIDDITTYRNGLYRKCLYNSSALECFSAHTNLMSTKRKYVRDWQRICLCISFCRAMKGSPLMYSFFPLLPSILDATKIDPTPGDYIPMRQRKYLAAHQKHSSSTAPLKKRKKLS